MSEEEIAQDVKAIKEQVSCLPTIKQQMTEVHKTLFGNGDTQHSLIVQHAKLAESVQGCQATKQRFEEHIEKQLKKTGAFMLALLAMFGTLLTALLIWGLDHK